MTWHRLWLAIFILLSGLRTPAAATDTVPAPEVATATVTTPCPSGLRAQDSFWVISTRHLGCPSPCAPSDIAFQVQQYQQEQGWQEAQLADLLTATTPQPLTVLYVHGNREDWCTAQERAWCAYGALIQAAGDPPPVRFVLWSWPSTQIRGVLQDVLVKAARSDCDAYYLAQFLAQLDPQTHVGLMGFSYGARIVTGALHLLGGGSLIGLQLPEARPEGVRNIRVALLAAAVHDYWLLPGQAHGRALSQVDRLLVQVNPCDRILRLYPHLDRCTKPSALGYSGFRCLAQAGDDGLRVAQQNVACAIGSDHNIYLHLGSPVVMGEVQRYVLWKDVQP